MRFLYLVYTFTNSPFVVRKSQFWLPVGTVSFYLFIFYFIFIYLFLLFLLYNIVLVLSYFNMYPPQVYTCSLDLPFVIIIIHNGLPQRILPFCLTVKLYCSIDQLCPTVCDPTDCSMSGFPVLCQLPELAQTHVHWVIDAIQPSCPLSSLFPPAINLSHHQGLF